MSEKVKTPEQYAEKEMNKKIGKAIAKREIKVKKLQAEIKKLKSGEMLPDEDDDDESSSPKEIIKERIVEVEKPIYYPYVEPTPKPFYPKPLYPKPFYKEPRLYTRWITNKMDNRILC